MAVFTLTHWMNHYNSKEIAKKVYFIIERIFRHEFLVNNNNSYTISLSLNIIIDINFLIVIKGAAKYINKDNLKVIREIDNSFNKLIKEINKKDKKQQKLTK
jgi:hypothetical protein